MRVLHCRHRHALGRVDVLVGDFILVLALTIGMVSSQRHRHDSDRSWTIHQMKQMLLAVYSHHDNFRWLPPAYDARGQLRLPATMHVHLLPYLGEDALYRRHMAGSSVSPAVISSYISPKDTTFSNAADVQNFAGNLRVFSNRGLKTRFDQPLPKAGKLDPGNAWVAGSFPDGTSNTIMLATKFGVCGTGGSKYNASPRSPFGAFFGVTPATRYASSFHADATFQLAPSQANCISSPFMAQSFVRGPLDVGMSDGSVRPIAPSIRPDTWNRALQPNDGKAMGNDWNP